MSTKTFKEIKAWQLAHQFVLEVYRFTKNFPREEIYCLTSQFRRAAISVAANICEGYKKKGKKDKLRFYNISQGSIEECRYYIILSKDLEYGCSQEMDELLDSVGRKLYGYIKSIEESMM
ncbi:MAG: four helix bundle protein [Candidatus Cloacimonetes bacterium]|nr:four helix bundle protein [Candidatus Cloacimonadota bacterium]